MAQEKNAKLLVLVIHNVRSALNVGALFRTADGAGVERIILSGYTPAPPKKDSPYLTSAEKAFKKTALGAEEHMSWKKSASLGKTLSALKKEGCEIVALEQCELGRDYRKYDPKSSVALIVGNEVRGIDAKILKRCDVVIEIPMRGKKNSLNVSVAAGIALYGIASTMKI
ncbi:MAG: TrmH family RNA methyltransferase [Candidatus Moraniibacteriota bacterium]